MFVVQSSQKPGAIRNGLADLLPTPPKDLRIFSAYVSREGSDIFQTVLRNSTGDHHFTSMPKLLVTSFDFGLTDPEALRDWLNLPNSAVYVAGSELVTWEDLTPKYAFHPKVYAFGFDDSTYSALIGSANLTARGLTVNSEAAYKQTGIPPTDAQQSFDDILQGTTALTEELLDAYGQLREKTPPSAGIAREPG